MKIVWCIFTNTTGVILFIGVDIIHIYNVRECRIITVDEL